MPVESQLQFKVAGRNSSVHLGTGTFLILVMFVIVVRIVAIQGKIVVMFKISVWFPYDFNDPGPNFP